MRLFMIRTIAALLVLPAWLMGLPVEAQTASDDNRTTTVMGRARPETDPVGIRAGGFFILPEFAVSESYNDNLFAAQSGTVDDFISNIEPAIVIKSNWSRHSLVTIAKANFGLHSDRSDEDYQDYSIGGDLRLDLFRDTYMTARLRYQKLHEGRGSPDDAGGIEPGEYELINPVISLFNRFNRFSILARGSLNRFDFDDVPIVGGTVNHDDRDRDRNVVVLRGGYEITPEYEGFVRASYNTTNYDDAVDDNGFNRDSDGYEIVAGTRIDLTGVTFGDVFVGYMSSEFDDSSLKRIDGITFGADLTWNVTELTTIRFGVVRTIEETTSGSASGTFDTAFNVSADHELMRSLILSAKFGAKQSDYEGIARKDDYRNFGLAGKYLLNRNLNLVLQYDRINRESDAVGADFTSNVFMLRLVGQL